MLRARHPGPNYGGSGGQPGNQGPAGGAASFNPQQRFGNRPPGGGQPQQPQMGQQGPGGFMQQRMPGQQQFNPAQQQFAGQCKFGEMKGPIHHLTN